MTQQFTTPAPITAVLDMPAGRVQLIAADRGDTVVEVRPADASKHRDVKAAEQTTVEYRDGVLRVELPTSVQILGPSGSIEVTVQLPAGSDVQATGAATDFRGVGRLGQVAVEAAQSETKLDEAAGARVTLQAGNVTVGRLTGGAEISIAKGDIRIDEAVRGSLVLGTQAGDITVVTAPGVSATLDAGATYGRIQNALTNTKGADAELAIQASTSYGNIEARSL
ncbi:DUF4097 family beta strand repeat-containing protein [Agromyces sp. G08B096]|uniref:DUF4097 family beta strand repeat-containing protein n=1 Tax=Agromyces sp. G08B096 TaxID=3156399 RepID=A0AAU7W488_9MICO